MVNLNSLLVDVFEALDFLIQRAVALLLDFILALNLLFDTIHLLRKVDLHFVELLLHIFHLVDDAVLNSVLLERRL